MSPNLRLRKEEPRLGRTWMSAKELRRGEVLRRVKQGDLKLTEAAELLEIS